jgi:hypothetical protein
MYCNVPRIVPSAVIGTVGGNIDELLVIARPLAFANPKSSNFAPDFVSMMLPGFQIAMDDPLAMCLIERVSDLNRVLQYLVECQRTLVKALRQRLSLQMLHDQKIDPILSTHVVEHADVRMAELGYCFGFALEPLAEPRVSRELRGEHLDCDGAVEACISRLVDLSHPASSDGASDFVRAETHTRAE